MYFISNNWINIQDLEEALGEVVFVNGIPDIKFSRVSSLLLLFSFILSDGIGVFIIF